MIININKCIIIIVKCLDLLLYEYERDRCEKSVHQCYSLVDNTSERWTKLKNIANKHITQFKLFGR